MSRRKAWRWFGATVLGTVAIAQGYCLPANYWANSGRNAAVALADALLLQYVFLPIADQLGITTVDPILNPNQADVTVAVDPTAMDMNDTTTP